MPKAFWRPGGPAGGELGRPTPTGCSCLTVAGLGTTAVEGPALLDFFTLVTLSLLGRGTLVVGELLLSSGLGGCSPASVGGVAGSR